MNSPRATSVASCLIISAMISTHALSESAAPDFSLPCNLQSQLSEESPLLSLDEDTVRAIIVFTSGGADCEALDEHTDCEELLPSTCDLPPFAEALWDSTRTLSVSRFYLDNSRGASTLEATIVDRSPNDANDDTCV